jgi:hypothetical protein
MVVAIGLPPSVNSSSKTNDGTDNTKNANITDRSTLEVTSLLHVEIHVHVPSLIKVATNTVQDSMNSAGDGVLESTNKSHGNEEEGGLKHGLLSPLNTVKLVALLVNGWSGIKVGVLNITFLASLHHISAHHAPGDKRANEAAEKDIAVIGRNLESHKRHGRESVAGFVLLLNPAVKETGGESLESLNNLFVTLLRFVSVPCDSSVESGIHHGLKAISYPTIYEDDSFFSA